MPIFSLPNGVYYLPRKKKSIETGTHRSTGVPNLLTDYYSQELNNENKRLPASNKLVSSGSLLYGLFSSSTNKEISFSLFNFSFLVVEISSIREDKAGSASCKDCFPLLRLLIRLISPPGTYT